MSESNINLHGEAFVSTMARVNPIPPSTPLSPAAISNALTIEEREEFLRRAYILLEGEVANDPHYGRVDEESARIELPRKGGLPECPVSCFGGVLLGDMSPREAYRVAYSTYRQNAMIHTSEEAILRWALPTLLMGERTDALAETYAAGVSPFGGEEPTSQGGDVFLEDRRDGNVESTRLGDLGQWVENHRLPDGVSPREAVSSIGTSPERWALRMGYLSYHGDGDDISIIENYLADGDDLQGRLVHKQRRQGMELVPSLWGYTVPTAEGMAVARLRQSGIGRKPQPVAQQGVTSPTPPSKEALRLSMLELFAKGLITSEEMLKYC